MEEESMKKVLFNKDILSEIAKYMDIFSRLNLYSTSQSELFKDSRLGLVRRLKAWKERSELSGNYHLFRVSSRFNDTQTMRLLMIRGNVSKEDIFDAIQDAVETQSVDALNLCLTRSIPVKPNNALYEAAKSLGSKRRDIVDILIKAGYCNWEAGIRGAAEVNDMELMKFFFTKYNLYDAREAALKGAAAGGHVPLLEQFMKEWQFEEEAIVEAIKFASSNGMKKSVLYLLPWVSMPHITKIIMERGIRKNQKEIIDLAIELGFTDWDLALHFSSSVGDLDNVMFFLEKGAKNLCNSLRTAFVHRKEALIDFLVGEMEKQKQYYCYYHKHLIECYLENYDRAFPVLTPNPSEKISVFSSAIFKIDPDFNYSNYLKSKKTRFE